MSFALHEEEEEKTGRRVLAPSFIEWEVVIGSPEPRLRSVFSGTVRYFQYFVNINQTSDKNIRVLKAKSRKTTKSG